MACRSTATDGISARGGVEILYSSDLVRPWMRVSESRGPSNRTRLAEIVAPHGLAVSPGQAVR